MCSQVGRCLCFVSLLLGVSSGNWAASIYTFTTIDYPDATSHSTVANGINDAGQIVGYFNDSTGKFHGFLKDGATFTTIDVPGASATFARGINDAGQIVGFFQNPGDHGFLKDGAAFATIDRPGAIATDAIGIYDAGQIVGLFLDDTVQTHGFVATLVPELATWLQFGSSLMGLLWGGRQATGRNLISA